MATTLLLTHESLKTTGRGSASQQQEHAVGEAMRVNGFVFDDSSEKIGTLDMLPRGHYSRERMVDGSKCDVPIRLRDGRLLALECKVSNGPKNGWKRVCREVGGKSTSWAQEFGTQVLTGAVLAGVFDLACLVKGQNEQNVTIFWQHDLAPLAEFVAAVR